MGYWDQYGLGEYADGFDKLGIRSIDELREQAQELEENYGLDGLCDLLGVEKQYPQPPTPQPTPTPKPSPRDKKLKKAESTMGILAVGAIAIMVIIIVVMALGAKWGFFKGSLTVNLTTAYPDLVSVADAKMMAIAIDGDHSVKSTGFNKDGQATLKLRQGTYDAYVLCDGYSYYLGRYSNDGLTHDTYDQDLDKVMYRAVIVTFVDEKGNALVPDAVSVVRGSDGVKLECQKIDASHYILHLSNHMQEETLTITADDYAPIQVSNDWSTERLMEMEVTLEHE